jgi:hypothetical protein
MTIIRRANTDIGIYTDFDKPRDQRTCIIAIETQILKVKNPKFKG